MAMSGGGGDHRGTLNEINVTPLVDVMLVLLVVFMVTTPIMLDPVNRQVNVDLPATNSDTPLSITDAREFIMDARADYHLMIAGDKSKQEPDIELADCSAAKATNDFSACLGPLEEKLRANDVLKVRKKLYLQADRNLPYGFVVDVMARIKNAGIPNVGLVTNPPGGPPKP